MSSERGVRGELCGGIWGRGFQMLNWWGLRGGDIMIKQQAGRQASIGFFLFLVSLCV